MQVTLKSYNLGKERRIRSNFRFREIISDRFCICNDVLVVFVMKNGKDASRVGVSVGKKFGNAVSRNYLKRLLREAFRLSTDNSFYGFDFILMYNSKTIPQIRNNKRSMRFIDVQNAFEDILRKLSGRLSEQK